MFQRITRWAHLAQLGDPSRPVSSDLGVSLVICGENIEKPTTNDPKNDIPKLQRIQTHGQMLSDQILSRGWFFTNPFEKYDRQNGLIFSKLRG